MDNDNYITINEQGLAEINPTASSDMQNAFIDAYRNIQGENTAQIGTQAHALGSDLEAQYGGLHGPSEYMKSRYQTPQTESRIAGLRTASQLSALNQLMQNDVNSWKDKYTQAYRDAQKRARARALASTTPYTGNTGGSGDELNINTTTGAPDSIDVNTNPNTGEGNIIQTGNNTYQNVSTGESYSPAPTSFMGAYNQGMSLGVWPDGSPFVEGSSYSQGGRTYTYQKFGNTPTPNVYQVN